MPLPPRTPPPPPPRRQISLMSVIEANSEIKMLFGTGFGIQKGAVVSGVIVCAPTPAPPRQRRLMAHQVITHQTIVKCNCALVPCYCVVLLCSHHTPHPFSEARGYFYVLTVGERWWSMKSNYMAVYGTFRDLLYSPVRHKLATFTFGYYFLLWYLRLFGIVLSNKKHIFVLELIGFHFLNDLLHCTHNY